MSNIVYAKTYINHSTYFAPHISLFMVSGH